MKLPDYFAKLNPPTGDSSTLFNTVIIPAYSFARVGVNQEGYPALLIAPIADGSSFSQRNIRLKNLELSHNIEFRIDSNGISNIDIFTVIVFKSNQAQLQAYFLSISETLLSSLSARPSQQEVAEAFKAFVEIFRALSEPPTNTVHGLWSELFVIEHSKSPSILLTYRHNVSHERFDFNADVEKLEVKSSSTMERIHVFSSEQLNPPSNTKVIIASLFVRQLANGQSIADLSESISKKISDPTLLGKMYGVIAQTLGETLEQSIKLRFDYALASGSLKFYQCEDVQKIEVLSIPVKVSDVKYKSDLTEIKPIKQLDSSMTGPLFQNML